MAILKKVSSKASNEWKALIEGNAEDLINAILLVLSKGDMITFARTRDGKAVLVSLYNGKENEKVYIGDDTEAKELFSAIEDVYGNNKDRD